jgi:hypothetical protein
VENNYYSFDCLESIDWKNIRQKYPMAFSKYMIFPDLETFMIALNCTIEVNHHLNSDDSFFCWETRVETKQKAISVIGFHTFGETKNKTIELLFEMIENQMKDERFKRN